MGLMDQNNWVRAERLPGAGADGLRTSSDWDRVAKPVGELWAGESGGTGHSVERNGPGLLRVWFWGGACLEGVIGKERV